MSAFEMIVQHYKSEYRSGKAAELEVFRKHLSLQQAISLAGQATDGTHRFSHQFRLTKAALNSATAALLASVPAIQQCGDFEELIALIDDVVGGIPGIGELYVYDTALRVGANVRIEPRRVYLHRGTRTGARALGLDGTRKSISPSHLPPALRELRPHEIEDLLCIYKGNLKRASEGASLREIATDSACRYGRPPKSQRRC